MNKRGISYALLMLLAIYRSSGEITVEVDYSKYAKEALLGNVLENFIVTAFPENEAPIPESLSRLGKANFTGDLSGKVKLSCSPLVFNCFALWPSSDELSAPAVYRRLKLRRPSDIALSQINNQAGVLAELIRDQQWEEGKRAYQSAVAVLRATDSDCDVQPGYILLFNMRRETNKLLMVLLDDEGFSAATRTRFDKQINFEQMVLLGMIRSALGDVDAGRTDRWLEGVKLWLVFGTKVYTQRPSVRWNYSVSDEAAFWDTDSKQKFLEGVEVITGDLSDPALSADLEKRILTASSGDASKRAAALNVCRQFAGGSDIAALRIEDLEYFVDFLYGTLKSRRG